MFSALPIKLRVAKDAQIFMAILSAWQSGGVHQIYHSLIAFCIFISVFHFYKLNTRKLSNGESTISASTYIQQFLAHRTLKSPYLAGKMLRWTRCARCFIRRMKFIRISRTCFLNGIVVPTKTSQGRPELVWDNILGCKARQSSMERSSTAVLTNVQG